MSGDGGHASRIALRRLLGGAALVVAWLCAGGAASAEADADAEEPAVLYQWTDPRGVYRYTPDYDRVPERARGTVVTIQTGEGPPSNTPTYFDPDPRSKQVEVPVPEPATGTARGTPRSDDTEYEDRIRELEARIAADEEVLKARISNPAIGADEVTPELREIADRLPRFQAELDSLQRGRARQGKP